MDQKPGQENMAVVKRWPLYMERFSIRGFE